MLGWLLKGSLFYLVLLPVLFFPLSLGFAQAQNLTPPVAPACEASPEAYLNARLSVWQQRLKLEAWKITITPSRRDELKPDTLGNIHWDSEKRSAQVRVLALTEYSLPCAAAVKDMELTVVHELVHLVLSTLPRAAADRGNEEHAVNQLAGALLDLDRTTRQDTAPQVTSVAH